MDEFFKPGEEILIAGNHEDTLKYLKDINETKRKAIGNKARQVILENHTSLHRAQELEQVIFEYLEISV